MDNNLQEQIDKLQAFKDFVHRRLDEMNIPTNPDGEHSKAGCRIGDRLDIVQAALSAQSSNPSDKEVDEDLVKTLASEIAAHTDFATSCYGGEFTMAKAIDYEDAAKACVKALQSYADKQSMKFAEWAAKNDWRMSGYYEGNWNWYKNNEGKTTAELLTVFKESQIIGDGS